MFRNECNLKSKNEVIISDNNINNIIELHEEKIKSLLKKVHQLDELNIRTGGYFSSLTGKYHPGPLASITCPLLS